MFDSGFPEEMFQGDNRFSWYSMMRSSSPVFHVGNRKLWMFFKYNDVNKIFMDHENFSSVPPSRFADNEGGISNSFILMDHPEHAIYRSLVADPFLPSHIKEMEPTIEKIVFSLLEKIGDQGTFDFVSKFAIPLPVTVIADLLGIPESDREKFRYWSDVIIGNKDPTGAYSLFQDDMKKYFTTIIEKKRRDPDDSIIKLLTESEIGGNKISNDEIISFCQLLMVGGNETTTNLLGNMFSIFSQKPDLISYLESSSSSIESAIEESLRYYSPIQMIPHRWARNDISFQGNEIRKGDGIILWIGSANRDEAKYDDPETFRVDRMPKDHLAFGMGIHMCLGAPLARLEAKIALQYLIPYFKNYRIEESGKSIIKNPLVYGYEKMILKRD